MTSLSERLAGYPLLSPEERADVDREAAAHPELADALADAQALAALLDAPPPDLADAVADEAIGGAWGPAALVSALETDPSQADEIDRLRAHAAELLSGESGLDHFERLTGRTPAAPLPLRAAARPARTAADRPAATGRRTVSPLRRRVLVAFAAVLVGLGGLRVASEVAVPERARLADLSDLASYEPRVTRSTEADDLEARLDATLDGVADARRSVLGFFPRYDTAALDAAAAELASIAAGAPPASEVSQEARLALARVRLYESRDAEAARLLAALVRDGGYRAPEARRLLDFLRTQAPETPAEPG